MTVAELMVEYKTEMERLRTERDILRELLADEIQGRRRCEREQATAMVDMELFQRLGNGEVRP